MRMIFFDTETTGLDFKKDRIIELAFIIIEDNKVVKRYDEFIKCPFNLSKSITDLTGITDELLKLKGVSERVVAEDLKENLVKGSLMVAHNIHFDMNFIFELLVKYYSEDEVLRLFKGLYWLDTLTIFKDRKSYPHKLIDLVNYYKLGNFRFHRAIDDTKVLPLALKRMVKQRNDVKKYINIVGYNPKYSLEGRLFEFIKYIPQDYHYSMVKSSEILPYKFKLK